MEKCVPKVLQKQFGTRLKEKPCSKSTAEAIWSTIKEKIVLQKSSRNNLEHSTTSISDIKLFFNEKVDRKSAVFFNDYLLIVIEIQHTVKIDSKARFTPTDIAGLLIHLLSREIRLKDI